MLSRKFFFTVIFVLLSFNNVKSINCIELNSDVHYQPYPFDEILVVLKDGFTHEHIELISKENGLMETHKRLNISKLLESNLGGSIFLVKFEENVNIIEVINTFKKNIAIINATPNSYFFLHALPNDTLFDEQWALYDDSGDRDIDAQSAWDITQGSTTIKVGVIDSGVFLSHEDLQDNISGGYDFCDRTNNDTLTIAGVLFSPCGDYSTPDSNPTDEYGHGTHVAGIIAAKGNNNLGVSGVTWNCKIVPIRAFYSLQSQGGAYTASAKEADLIEALEYAVSVGCKIINMSFGTSDSTGIATLHTAITTAYNQGIIIVASSGNEGYDSPMYPAAWNEVISVGATDRYDTKTWYSSYGNWLDIAAPGDNVLSTTPQNDTFYRHQGEYDILARDYSFDDGTSMAAPHVSGLVALLLSYNPNLSNVQVKDIIQKSADKVGGYTYTNGLCAQLGYGRINAYQALFRAKGYGTLTTDMNIWHDTDFIDNVTIPAGVTLTIKENVNIRFADDKKLIVYGALNVNSGVVFTKTTSGTLWNGIEVKPGGTLNITGGITLEYATIGISINSNLVTFPATKSSIRFCRDWGMTINNCSPTIRNIDFQDNGTMDYHGGICVQGSGYQPHLQHITIDDSRYGLYLTSAADAMLEYSTIKYNPSTVLDRIYLYSYSGIDINGRRNNIYDNTNAPYAIKFGVGGPNIAATRNYWGPDTYPPTRAVLCNDENRLTDIGGFAYANIDSAGAPTAKIVIENFLYPFIEAEKKELNGDIPDALYIYRQIISSSPDEGQKRNAIKAIMRLCGNNNADLMLIHNIIINERINAKSWYKSSLDYLLCELLIKEEKYFDAINSFIRFTKEYKDEIMEVEMLARVATIYGDILHDKVKAKEYADKAALINPGQPILLSAYTSADIYYDPWKYIDKFIDKPIEPISFNEIETENVYSITISPNPANPFTTIKFSIDKPSHVRLNIYAINGQKIATLFDGKMNTGEKTVKFGGKKYASGVYFYRFESGHFKKNGKIIIIK